MISQTPLDLSVVTVTYCSEKHIERLIRSVQKGCTSKSYEHIVIDNASKDHTLKLIHSFGNGVTCIANAQNLGFSAANLIGYKQAKGKFLLFLNPDMVVEEGGLDKIVDWMETHPETAIAGCQLLDHDGKINTQALPRRFPKISEQIAILLKLDKIFPHFLDRYLYKDRDFSQEQAVDSVRGSFMMMQRRFIDALGWPFDPRYHIWFEDVDICREAWKHGFSVMYTPVTHCYDAIGQSFQQRDRRWRFRQYAQSLWRYFGKWEPMYIWCWVPMIYLPLAYAVGSNWFGWFSKKVKEY